MLLPVADCALYMLGSNSCGLFLVWMHLCTGSTGCSIAVAVVSSIPTRTAHQQVKPPPCVWGGYALLAHQPGICCPPHPPHTGTDADLRKLGNHKAGEIMLHKFKQPADKVAALGRWQRIDFIRRAVRDPANTALVNSDPELLQYVRNIKINFADQQARMGEAATAVFNAQVGGGSPGCVVAQ